MPANGCVYIQRDGVDLREVFDHVERDKGLEENASYYDVVLGKDTVRFYLMPSQEIPNHLQGFLRYIASLDHDQKRKDDTSYAISHTKVVLGLVTDKEFDENPAIWQSLFKIADKYDGLIFTYDSVLLPSGTILVGPLLNNK
ncbi:hypothetical protein [Acinetobacter nosocomialis]|uniref:hypothetical protein n=1 Tax=Acinetobacter nosocomialis TaxID=106654 RepID=UPI0026F4167E|nr:hypothetical protein [Acinetobacter nosocomialis]MDO7438043.1 hypothetical protein [Acinetobacter nosocomialis]